MQVFDGNTTASFLILISELTRHFGITLAMHGGMKINMAAVCQFLMSTKFEEQSEPCKRTWQKDPVGAASEMHGICFTGF